MSNKQMQQFFDRTNGKLLLAKQFIKNLNWASGMGSDGRPIKLPNQEPTEASLCEKRESEDRAVSRMQWRQQEAFSIAACTLARQDWQHHCVPPITCRTGSSCGA